MLNAVAQQLRAVAELVGGRPIWRERLSVADGGLARSFVGPVIVVALLAVFEAGALKSQLENAHVFGLVTEPPGFWPSYGAYATAYLAKTVIFLGAVVGFADTLRVRGSTPAYVAAHNWLSALIAGVQATPFALYLINAVSLTSAYSVYLLGLGFSAYARWRCAREALGVDRQLAVALAAGEILLYLFAIDAFENAFGVTAAEAPEPASAG